MTIEENLENEHQKNIDRGLTFEADDTDENKPLKQAISERGCLFCNQEERYNRNLSTEYICGSCIELLLSADQDDLKREHKLAADGGYECRARALNSFIIPEGQEYEQRKPKSKSGFNINRKRSFRSIRNKEERIRLATA